MTVAFIANSIWVALSTGIKQHNYTYSNTLVLNGVLLMGYNYNFGVGAIYWTFMISSSVAHRWVFLNKRDGLCLLLDITVTHTNALIILQPVRVLLAHFNQKHPQGHNSA